MFFSKTRSTSAVQSVEERSGMLSNRDLEILWVARTLTNIYVQCEDELVKLERSEIPEELKRPVKDVILSRYQERRMPYADLLQRLQGRQHG